jgi:hypothetical protein
MKYQAARIPERFVPHTSDATWVRPLQKGAAPRAANAIHRRYSPPGQDIAETFPATAHPRCALKSGLPNLD